MNLLTSFRWSKQLRARGYYAAVEVPPRDETGEEEDTRQAVLVEDLSSEWMQALEAADYSHLPTLDKINGLT